MKKWLKDKTIIITGASGGLGFNMAKLFIEKYNCTVIALARSLDKLNSAKLSLNQNADKFITLSFDASVNSEWLRLSNYLIEQNIQPDVLINNAGFMLPFVKFEDYSDAETDEILKTNLYSVIYGTKTLLPLLKKSSSPAIINISSLAGNCAVVGQSLYCLTKFGVKGFTDTLKQEYKKQIYVACVHPGFIKTNILHRMSELDKQNKLINGIMLPVEKASKRIVKRVAKKRKTITTGLDGKTLSFIGRISPKLASNMITFAFRRAKLQLFDGKNSKIGE